MVLVEEVLAAGVNGRRFAWVLYTRVLLYYAIFPHNLLSRYLVRKRHRGAGYVLPTPP